ncbi:hypothetical protein D910_09574 [Dendroctonus ponderosae]|uniref:Reverse transcriptase domain-containing protein n=1 Tax=Dendroctonus ponderosae TaxID=77166 RepID=U4UGV3_DENPD|nr:hypothetical protein D910_09574 [Dendroctonus ponderosae]
MMMMTTDTIEREARENNRPAEEDGHETTVRRAVRKLRTKTVDSCIAPTSPEGVAAIIGHSKTRKAPGRDGITNKMLKSLPRKGLVTVTNLTNDIFRTSHFPRIWKQSDVIMLPKPKTNRAPSEVQAHEPAVQPR